MPVFGAAFWELRRRRYGVRELESRGCEPALAANACTLRLDAEWRSGFHSIDFLESRQVIAVYGLHQIGGDDEDQLSFVFLERLRAEQVAENRNVTETGILEIDLSRGYQE